MGTIARGWRFGLALGGCLAACGGSISHEPGGASAGGKGGTASTTDDDLSSAGTHVTAAGGKPSSGAAGKAGRGGSAGVGGRAPATAGAATGGGGGGLCPGNQILLNGMCACPAYAPSYCAAVGKCVNTAKDPQHCGTCDTQCGPMSACSSGVCTPEPVTFAQSPICGTLLLQVAAGKLYGLTSKTGTLFSITLPGGESPVTVAADLTGGSAFVVDDVNAYVAKGQTVTQVNLATGGKTVLVTETATIFDVAVANGKIYYATGKYIKQADAALPSVGVAVASAADEGEPQGVAISGATVLFASNLSFNVELDPIVGDGHVKVGASQGGLVFGHRSVQADATNVYWTNGAAQRARITGPDYSASTVAQPIDGSAIVAFAIDSAAQMAYFATEDGNFEKSSFDKGAAGEEATWVLRGLDAVGKTTSVVLDDTSAYIASGCIIHRTPR